ncbi:hypothetical protein [Sphingomonas sp.]|uniref:hypothetical protein n=1 Tax=Sphingomonas sp. TaxID=28214 RepID=UPI001B23E54A|nr:hypothetical protein [Sphingomonas sp.]MBO9712238.1 hypothetical protein [Sphingomonas sp.]
MRKGEIIALVVAVIGVVFAALAVPIFQGPITRFFHSIGWGSDAPATQPESSSNIASPPDNESRAPANDHDRNAMGEVQDTPATSASSTPTPTPAPTPSPSPTPTPPKIVPGNGQAADRSCTPYSRVVLIFSRSSNADGAFNQVESNLDIQMKNCSGSNFTAVFDTGAETSYAYEGTLTDQAIHFDFGYDQTYWSNKRGTRVKCTADGTITDQKNVYEGSLLCHWYEQTLRPFGIVKIIVR